jgi:hypothetical protein
MQRIKPAPGMIVIDPLTRKPLRAIGLDGLEGEAKEIDSFWLRRLNDGDVLQVEFKESVPPAAAGRKSKKGTEGN